MNENTEQNVLNTEAQAPVYKAPKKSLWQRFKLFFKSNSDMIVKLYVHQFGLTVFGYLLYSAASASKNKPLILGLGIFSAVFYLFVLYVLSWDVGAKDKIRIDGGRLTRDKFKGGKVALFGMLPNLVFATAALLGFVLQELGAWAKSIYGIAQIIGVFLNSMYIGIDEYIGIATQPFYLYLICLPAIIVCCVGYLLGTYEKYGVLTSASHKNKRR